MNDLFRYALCDVNVLERLNKIYYIKLFSITQVPMTMYTNRLTRPMGVAHFVKNLLNYHQRVYYILMVTHRYARALHVHTQCTRVHHFFTFTYRSRISPYLLV